LKQYHDYLRHILREGVPSGDRTGTGTISTFGYELRFHLQKGVPLVTTKHVSFKNVASEILWMLKGGDNVEWLNDKGNHIWDPWADENGDLGPVYGKQWVSWPTHFGREINQIAEAARLIRTDPTSRRIVVSAWNVGQLSKMALHPCHMLFQWRVTYRYDHLGLLTAARSIDGGIRIPPPEKIGAQGEEKSLPMNWLIRGLLEAYGDSINVEQYRQKVLSLRMDIRSSDAFIGMPYNIAGYALLNHMMAHQSGMHVGDLIIHVGDAHIYSNHMEQVEEQLSREPSDLPMLRMNRLPDDIFGYELEDFEVVGYHPHGKIAAPIAV